MDNNFNQQQPQQGQPVYQQPQGQPMYQQPMYQQPPKKPASINVMELVALICSAVGTVMAIVGSALTCSCSASKSWDADALASNIKSNGFAALADFTSGSHKMSLVCIIAILGAIIAAAGVVLAIVALKQKNVAVKAGKLAYVAAAVGVFGFMYGLLPVLTICGYNCSLNSSYEDALGSSLSDFNF